MSLLAIEFVRGSEKNGFRILILGQDACCFGIATPKKELLSTFKEINLCYLLAIRYWQVA